MFAEVQISENIKRIIYDLAKRSQFENITEIRCCNGAQIGDGFGSDPIAVEVKNNSDSLQLFLKCSIGGEKDAQQEQSYANEIFFYDTIYPTYKKFLEMRKVEGFKNAPKFYGVYKEKSKDIIVLENLRAKGYTLFNRHSLMDDAHLNLVLRTFAKFHAISFALKDQQPNLHEEFCSKCYDIIPSMEAMGFFKLLKDMIEDFLAKLHPIDDKDILEACDEETVEKIVNYARNSNAYFKEYTILTKGDCWSNNMMILYEDQSESKPLDLMLIDWQLVRRGSPVCDLMNLFFSVISEESLQNCEYYLKIYHDQLSKSIIELGSDPNLLYPYKTFLEEWKRFGAFGFGAAVILIKMMLSDGADETPNFDGMKGGKELQSVEQFIPKMKKEDEYLRRMKYVARYFIRNKYL